MEHDVGKLLKIVAWHFGVSVEDILGRKRDEDTTRARHVAMYIMRHETDMTLEAIGNELGGRTPSTALHGHMQIKRDDNVTRIIDEWNNAMTEVGDLIRFWEKKLLSTKSDEQLHIEKTIRKLKQLDALKGEDG